jgi:transposase
MAYWAKAPVDRSQLVLFANKLDDAISEDHPVRLLDEMLAEVDWSQWENRYCGVAGQPAIHPRVMAGAILYGLTAGIRTSRGLEQACLNRLDFLWLVEGRDIDHSTFAKFRKDFGPQVKALFKQVGRLALAMDLVHLNLVAFDGTRVRANSSRHATASAKTLQERLARMDQDIERLMAEAQAAEEAEQALFGQERSGSRLPKELASLKKRQEAMKRALAKAREADARRAERGQSSKGPASVPVADPDAAVMPNKEGGYAPNYTPMVATDGAAGIIVDADVLSETNESASTAPSVERIEETFGAKPKQVLADSNHGTGANLEKLEEAGVEALIPVEGGRTAEAVKRPDGSRPVAESQWPTLPKSPQTGKLDRSAFLYDKEADCYWCPTGRRLAFAYTAAERRGGGQAVYRMYRCEDCAGCPLAGACLSKQAKRRTVGRDQYEPLREAMRARLASEEGRAAYRRRAPLVEGTTGVIKAVLGVRQFLLRGLKHVKTEWLWVCTAFNLKKMIAVRVAGMAGTGL